MKPGPEQIYHYIYAEGEMAGRTFSYNIARDINRTAGEILMFCSETIEKVDFRPINDLAAINEELCAANEKLNITIDELSKTQQELEINLSRLQLSEGRFQNLVEDASVGIIVLTGEDAVVEIVNSAYAKLIGRTVSELYHRRLFEIIPEAEVDFRRIIDGVRLSGKAVRLDETYFSVHSDGEIVDGYLNLVYQPFRDADGSINGTMVLCQDVTQQVKAKKELQDNEQRFRFMLNAIPQQVWTAQSNGTLDYVNENVSSDFGKNAEDIIGEGWQAFIHPEDLSKALEAWQKALQFGNEYTVEFRLKFNDGEYHWHLARARPLIEDGKIISWIGTNTNIGLQKRNEQNKDEFLSIASHELKTPLTGIKAFNQIMGKINDAGQLKLYIAKSASSITRLEKLITDLLDVTKINAGKLNYTMEQFNFGQMIAESVENMQHLDIKQEIILESNADIIVSGDRFRLEQVMNNFLSNAVKYAPKTDKVIVTCKVQGDSVVVSVQDFGIGIAQDRLDKLFNRYYRVDNTAMRFEGLGLGLFISSEILKRHNGTFWIESTEGEGSTFYFSLPIRPEIIDKTSGVDKGNTYYKDPTITINFNKAENRLEVNWTGFQNMETVKNGCMRVQELFIRNNCRKILNDNRQVQGNWSEAAEWVGRDWFPVMEKHGLRYLAWILSPNSFSQFSAKKSIEVKEDSVITEFFTESQAAEEWINSRI